MQSEELSTDGGFCVHPPQSAGAWHRPPRTVDYRAGNLGRSGRRACAGALGTAVHDAHSRVYIAQAQTLTP